MTLRCRGSIGALWLGIGGLGLAVVLSVGGCPLAPGVDTFSLTAVIQGQGTVRVAPGGDAYDLGAEVMLTATADDGWAFDRWEGGLSGSDNPATITMDSDKTIIAIFTGPVSGPFASLGRR